MERLVVLRDRSKHGDVAIYFGVETEGKEYVIRISYDGNGIVRYVFVAELFSGNRFELLGDWLDEEEAGLAIEQLNYIQRIFEKATNIKYILTIITPMDA